MNNTGFLRDIFIDYFVNRDKLSNKMMFVTILCLTVAFTCVDREIAAQDFNHYCVLWKKVKEQQHTCQSSLDRQDSTDRKLENHTMTLIDVMKSSNNSVNHRMDSLADQMNNSNSRIDSLEDQINNLISLNNETNNCLTSKLESQTLKLETLELLEEIKILNDTLMDVNESKTNLEMVNEGHLSEIHRLQNEKMDFNHTLTKHLKECADERLKFEEKIQKLLDENEYLKNETMKLNRSMAGCGESSEDKCSLDPSRRWISGGHMIRDTFSNVITRVQQVNNKYDMYSFKADPCKMSVVNNRLWVSLHDKHEIHIVDPDTVQTIKQITHPQLRRPLSVRYHKIDQVLVSSKSGLHLVHSNGSYITKLLSGVISDIHLDCNVAHIYNASNNNVVRLTYNNSVWLFQYSFVASKSSGNYLSTLVVVNNTIYVCSINSHTIHKYSWFGNYLAEFGTRGSNTPGYLYEPRICGVDSQMSLLICDDENHRLQVLSADGTWTVFVLQGVPDPEDLIIDKAGNVWVLYYDIGSFKLSKYLV